MQENEAAKPAFEELSPELREEIRLARRCFVSLERLTSLMMSYPPGHPVIEEASENSRRAFYDFFELTDRLTVVVDAHSMKYLGTDERVWETEEPRDYCWVLSRDGVYLIHILAGIEPTEIRKFVDVLNELVDERDLTRDAVSVLFESQFRYISYDAIDESLAALAGLDEDIRDRDTKEEKEAIEELFEDAFDQDAVDEHSEDKMMGGDFQIRMEKRTRRMKRLEMGSREFLRLTEEDQQHLLDLKRGFTEHAELEHREGEILAAILGAKPKENLRKTSIEQIGEVMGGLLETNRPWEALAFLKLIHEWRENFSDTITAELKEIVSECFTQRRVQALTKMAVSSDQRTRRAILQMFNALHLDQPSEEFARMLGWDLEEEAEADIIRYLRERSRYGLGFVKETIFELPPEKTKPLLQIVAHHMPRSKPILLRMVSEPVDPDLKVLAIKALSGTWTEDEIRTHLQPLFESNKTKVKLAALRAVADADPSHIPRILGPKFDGDIAKRPEEEVREMASLFVQYGGSAAIDKLEALIHVRGMMVSEDQKQLATMLAKMLARSPNEQIIELLSDVGGDWRVPGKVRNTCKELAELLTR